MPPYHIALAEDHIMIRETIKKCIEEVPGLQVVVELSDGTEVLEFLKHSVPDMLILDLHMPQLNGIEATKIIKSLYPEIKILILTMHKSKVHFGQAFKAGADGYILKENALADLIFAINTIRAGNRYISSLVLDQVMDFFSGKPDDDLLTKREKEILILLAEGNSSKQIAQILAISFTTVNNYRMRIKRKLGTSKTADLTRYAMQKGYVILGDV
ncbi:MAG TPA: response regulator transcription factor [Desulfobaccales bacterium]|nr:response regulator transcription factor [Desulfobaccales bacterium]